MKIYRLLILAVCFLFVVDFIRLDVVHSDENKGAIVSPKSPKDLIKDTLRKIVQVNESLAGDEKFKERRSKLREIIEPHFDFEEIAKRSLGAHWLKMPQEKRKEFIKLFSDLLANTYMARIESVKEDMVKIGRELFRGSKAIVETRVINDGSEFPIIYKFMNKNGRWVVYDIVIENIGLIANYRNEFAGIIRKDGYDGLIKRLREKVGNPEQDKGYTENDK